MTQRQSDQFHRLKAIVDHLLRDHDVKQDAELAQKLGDLRDAVSQSSSSAEALEIELSRILFRSGQQPAAQLQGLPYPIYDHLQALAANEDGPWAPALTSRPTVRDRKWRLLGQDIGLPIGIPASVLTMNSTWVAAHARNGFNVLTYKTVRSRPRPTLPPPNWIFLESPTEPLTPAEAVRGVEAVGDVDTWPRSLRQFSTANSFGVPSKAPDEWVPDVQRALGYLADDQILIVSVMGTFEELRGDDLIDDFVDVATLAAGAGARAIELNLSCPNGIVDGQALRPLFEDAAMVEALVKSVRDSIDPTVALIAKCGFLETESLWETLGPVVGLLDGVSGINTLQASVRTRSGEYTFTSPSQQVRKDAGISGSALKLLARQFVSDVAALRRSRGLSFDIIGMGGVITPEDALALYRAGANAVQSASGAFFNPYLAKRLIDEQGNTFPRHDVADLVDSRKLAGDVLAVLRERGRASAGTLAVDLTVDPEAVQHVVDSLVDHGDVSETPVGRDDEDLLGKDASALRQYSIAQLR